MMSGTMIWYIFTNNTIQRIAAMYVLYPSISIISLHRMGKRQLFKCILYVGLYFESVACRCFIFNTSISLPYHIYDLQVLLTPNNTIFYFFSIPEIIVSVYDIKIMQINLFRKIFVLCKDHYYVRRSTRFSLLQDNNNNNNCHIVRTIVFKFTLLFI